MEEEALEIIRIPVSFSVFAERYPTEESCRKRFEKIRWKDAPFCFHCGGYKVYRYENKKDFKCGLCKKKFRITTGLICENSNLPLQKWLYVFYLRKVYQDIPDTKTLMDKMDISKPTAIRIRNKYMLFRKMKG